jgi:hypothetical protein
MSSIGNYREIPWFSDRRRKHCDCRKYLACNWVDAWSESHQQKKAEESILLSVLDDFEKKKSLLEYRRNFALAIKASADELLDLARSGED